MNDADVFRRAFLWGAGLMVGALTGGAVLVFAARTASALKAWVHT